jgi:quinol monooxygenase YgiN
MRIKQPRGNNSFLPIIFGVMLGIGISQAFYAMKGLAKSATSPKRIPGEAWALVVTIIFQSNQDLEAITKDWKEVAKYCAEYEPFLYHYEIGKSDSDPLKVHILERYESKEKYLNVHKNGDEFLMFRPKLKALQDEWKVSIEGFSYQELGQGFVSG